MMLFVTKATPFITNYSVCVELPQVINEYHYNSFNHSYYIHVISKGFIHVNALGVDTQTDRHTHTSCTKMISRNQAYAWFKMTKHFGYKGGVISTYLELIMFKVY